MRKYLLLLFILTAEVSYARLPGGEEVSITNRVVNGLFFSVSSDKVPDRDLLIVDITVTQTNGGNDDLSKLGSTVFYASLRAPLAATYNTKSLVVRIWVAPKDLHNITVEIDGPSHDLRDQPPIFAYVIKNLESFLKESGSEQSGATNALPQFKMWTGDIGSHQLGGVLSPSSTQTNYTARYMLDRHQHGELLKFTQEHLHQRVQFVLEGRVVGELYLTNEIANGVVDLPAKSREEAEEMVKGFTHF